MSPSFGDRPLPAPSIYRHFENAVLREPRKRGAAAAASLFNIVAPTHSIIGFYMVNLCRIKNSCQFDHLDLRMYHT